MNVAPGAGQTLGQLQNKAIFIALSPLWRATCAAIAPGPAALGVPAQRKA